MGIEEYTDNLKAAIESRNKIESKAHVLFTSPLRNGQRFAHSPGQCDPLGFVTVLRAALEDLMAGKKLANPYILKDGQ